MTSKFNALTIDITHPYLWKSAVNFIAVWAAAVPGLPADLMIDSNMRNRKNKLEGITEWAIRELGIHFSWIDQPWGGHFFVYYVNFPNLTPDEIGQRFREEFDNDAVYAAGFWYLQRRTKNIFSKFNNMGI